jgi:hypothetical protein
MNAPRQLSIAAAVFSFLLAGFRAHGAVRAADSPPPATEPTTRPAQLDLTVVDERSHQPLANASVVVRSPNGHEQNNLASNQIWLPGEWDAQVVKDYAVHGIPSIWLIGPDGKVIAKDLRGPAIKTAVANALGQ